MKVEMLPAIFLCLLGYAVSDTGNLKLGVYNGEVIVADGSCRYKEGCFFQNLSCRYLEHLKNNSITVVHYTDIESAVVAANCQKISAVLYFNENYTDAFVARLALEEDSDDETIEASSIRVWLDSNGKNADAVSQRLKSSYNEFFKELTTVCNTDRIQNYVESAFFYSRLAVYETVDEGNPDRNTSNLEDTENNASLPNTDQEPDICIIATNEAINRKSPEDIGREYLELEIRKLNVLEKQLNIQPLESATYDTEDNYFFQKILPQMKNFTSMQKNRIRQKIIQAIMDESEYNKYL